MKPSKLLCPLLLFAFSSLGYSGILKDHTTETSLFDGQPFVSQVYSDSTPESSGGVTASFLGDGEILKTVGAVFAHEDAFGNPNGGSPGALEFRLSFFESASGYLADPFLEAPASPNVFHLFQNVSNLGSWLTPIGTSPDGHNYFYWEFDVESLGIQTTAGSEQLVSIIPEVDFQSGPTFLALSSGGAGAIGSDLDWVRSRPASLGPIRLNEVGIDFSFGAYRVTTVPEPSFHVFVVLVVAVLYSLRSVKRSAIFTP